MKTHASDIAAGPRQARDQAVPDRIAAGCKDNRNRRGRGLGAQRRKGVADDHGDRPIDQTGN